jgi:hypothetical protein
MKKESTGNVSIYMKIWKAKQSIGKIHKSKTAKGEKFSYKYADLNSVLEIIDPILYENGLVCLQPIEDNKVYTFIVDIDSGEHISSFMTLPVLNDPQKLGSAISYYRRYTLTSCLSISTTDDDDGNAVSQAVKESAKPKMDREMFNNFLEALKKGTNKWPVEKVVDTYDLTKEQMDKIITV